MTDTNPPYEIGDIPSPANRFIQVPLANPISYIPVNGIYPKTKQAYRNQKTNPPQSSRAGFYGSYDIYRNLVVIFCTINQGRPYL